MVYWTYMAMVLAFFKPTMDEFLGYNVDSLFLISHFPQFSSRLFIMRIFITFNWFSLNIAHILSTSSAWIVVCTC